MISLADLQKDTLYSQIEQRFCSLGFTKKTFVSELQFAIMLVAENEKLRQCDVKSVLNAVLSVASCNLTLNPIRRFAYLVPFANTCRVMPSYLGMEKLVEETGVVRSISCQIVYENDDFAMDFANPKIITRHVPAFCVGKKRGGAVLVYSLATLQDGSMHCEVMDKEEILYIRNNFSETYKRTPQKSVWGTHEGEMMRKTVLKRHIKHLPKAKMSDFVYKTIELDNEVGGYEARRMMTFLLNNQEGPGFWQEDLSKIIQNKVDMPNT